MKTLLSALLFVTIALFSNGILQATENKMQSNTEFKLIMFEELGCEYCDLWNEEIGVTYSKTPEGKFAPLTRVFKGEPGVGHIKDFALSTHRHLLSCRVRNKEIGRILGYPGEDFFWVYLGEILHKAGFKPGS